MQKMRQRLVTDLLESAHRFYSLKYQMSDGGNLSARVPGTATMLVKGTKTDFGSLSGSTLAISDFEGNLVEGTVPPSKEARLHGAIYLAFPEIGGIMHCHSPWATAWADKRDSLTFSTYHSRIKLGDICPVIDTGDYIVDDSHIKVILDLMRRYPTMKAFLLRGHGQVAVGQSIREAAMYAELVEETAKIALLSTLHLGSSRPAE